MIKWINAFQAIVLLREARRKISLSANERIPTHEKSQAFSYSTHPLLTIYRRLRAARSQCLDPLVIGVVAEHRVQPRELLRAYALAPGNEDVRAGG